MSKCYYKLFDSCCSANQAALSIAADQSLEKLKMLAVEHGWICLMLVCTKVLVWSIVFDLLQHHEECARFWSFFCMSINAIHKIPELEMK